MNDDDDDDNVVLSSSSSSHIQLSEEQKYILKQAQAPKDGISQIVRVTAAAGTGKTTTLLKLAERFADLGATSITYVTFNRAAAEDGRRRLRHISYSSSNRNSVFVDAKTLHSCAMSLLSQRRNEEQINPDAEDILEDDHLLMNETQLNQEIELICKDHVNTFLQDCYREIERRTAKKGNELKESMKLRAKKQVFFFIFKTLKSFCQSAHSEKIWMDPSNSFERNYYPVILYHRIYGDGGKAGFLVEDYEHRVHFYAEQANRVWLTLKQQDVRSYDLEMKRAQLLALEIPGSVLLVDECQDMDACQVHWLANQVLHRRSGKQIFFVGDAAQTIYSFRGARSTAIMNLDHTAVDCTLTKSWRFGPSIAKIANTVLFAKQNSPQTTGKTKRWQPYRVTGAGAYQGEVTAQSLLQDWQTQKVTVIAFANVTLLIKAVQLLGMAPPGDQNEENKYFDLTQQTQTDLSPFPKFHINGKGESSGRKKWKQVIIEIETLFRLYTSSFPIILPAQRFPDFANQNVTWQSFVDQVNNRELGRYFASVSVIDRFGESTMKAIHIFQDRVLNQTYTAEEADIILTTCHAAKGLEWDNVEVCEDFQDLMNVSKVEPDHITKQMRGFNFFRRDTQKPQSWQFNFRSYGDDVNLLYVACTRAKKKLCIPQTLMKFFRECDLLKEILESKRPNSIPSSITNQIDPSNKGGNIILFQQEKALTDLDLSSLFNSLVEPLRKELGLTQQHRMEELLIDTTEAFIPVVSPVVKSGSLIKSKRSKRHDISSNDVKSAMVKPRASSPAGVRSFGAITPPSVVSSSINGVVTIDMLASQLISSTGAATTWKKKLVQNNEVIEILDDSPKRPARKRRKQKNQGGKGEMIILD